MYYDTVEIKPVNGKWVANHCQMDGDRQLRKEYTPHAWGGSFITLEGGAFKKALAC